MDFTTFSPQALKWKDRIIDNEGEVGAALLSQINFGQLMRKNFDPELLQNGLSVSSLWRLVIRLLVVPNFASSSVLCYVSIALFGLNNKVNIYSKKKTTLRVKLFTNILRMNQYRYNGIRRSRSNEDSETLFSHLVVCTQQVPDKGQNHHLWSSSWSFLLAL